MEVSENVGDLTDEATLRLAIRALMEVLPLVSLVFAETFSYSFSLTSSS